MTAATSTTDRPDAPTRPRDAHVNPYTELAARIRAEGFLRRRYGYYVLRSGAVLGLLAATTAAFVVIGDSWWQMVTAVIFGVLFTQAAFLGHDAAHRQVFASGPRNEWAGILLANLVVGISIGWWQSKHTRHHANPNKVGADPDIAPGVVAFTERVADGRRTPMGRWLTARQGWLFFPLLLLEGLNLHVQGVRRVLAPEPVKRRGLEITLLAVRLVGFMALTFWVLSPGVAFAFLGVQLAVFGVYMGASFAPNHKGMPVVPADVTIDFLNRQVRMSRNISGGAFMDLLMGGLNLQAEHHLFPSMPRPNLRRVQPIVRAYCAEHGIPYTETTIWQSYGIVIRYLNEVGLRARDPWACPLATQLR
ncbi:fatty acid desaturase [Beutenbergia cavernae DSM 12333]|uniref:Fatty acid desaturase n=1 Tax=Beutenbergia cavernae (strain ATCC BAA-8 / DSM 12333 / CCUG 43141 / JCM 11478 / NBRC 16432 / NCIMB 13614 / HKI 0122) TaxID=471853 RepID=C5BY37_BEUC1|nr:acyl-CoA desaturase [Beutenbergia cavernae]ACQ78931.1 fatty acid desaturase [Beutenbergia cavernae DSM 12333]